jgi:uncharacterized protein (TIGR02246 family)
MMAATKRFRVALVVIATLIAPMPSAIARQGGDPPMSMPEASHDDRAAIEAVMREEDAAWTRGDASAFAARALPGIAFTNIIGMFSVGKPPFEAQHARIFSTIYKGSTLKQTVVQVSFVRPDVAIVDTLCELSGFHEVPSGVPTEGGVLRTRLEQVMVRNDGQWWVASFHNVTVNPAAIANMGPPR